MSIVSVTQQQARRIAVVARPEHLVLYSRLGQIDAAELERLIWEERSLFEWAAFIWPAEDRPLVLARMRSHRVRPSARTRDYLRANARVRRQVLRELDRNGPALSRELTVDAAPAGARHRWWGTRQVGLMLDLLQLRGEIAVAGRRGRERVWDLAHRVYPNADPIPWREAGRAMEEKRRRALGSWCERGTFRAYDDIPDDPVPPRVTFLSPFDRLIHDRARAKAVFDFDYRLEMYVPKAKRSYGYYVLPILRRDRILGRIDLARDKSSKALRVQGLWWEGDVKPVSLDRERRRLEAEVFKPGLLTTA